MAYIKNNWVDREGTTRYFESVDTDGAKIFTPDYTQVTELGTPVNADNMNHIEEGIAAGSFTKFDLNTTYAKNDLVTVIEDSSPVIYKSLLDNNIGNALSSSEAWEKISLGGGGGGLEIGDIGFTQMAIDETKGKRRVLNGSVIIQEQYVQFTNIVKNSVALNPDLACTEEEWQTEVTMSAFGLCGKFVIDDEAGTIRLPKYPSYFIGGVNNIARVVGNGEQPRMSYYNNSTLALIGTGNLNYTNGASTPSYDYIKIGGVEASTNNTILKFTEQSGLEAQVNPELIKGTYFIQVATGAETEDNIINEIELNNPFSLLDYKYSEYELNNISWLRSNGQYNSKAIYPAVYDLLLRIYNGAETKAGVSVKLSTGSYTDYDFVINTSNETFRLPIQVKDIRLTGTIPVDFNSGASVPTSTLRQVALYKADGTRYAQPDNTNGTVGISVEGVIQAGANNFTALTDSANTYMSATVNLSSAKNNSLYLYFYVGETVQNANLINAGRIEEKLVDLIPNNSNLITNYCTPDYENGIALSFTTSGLTYTIPDNGYLSIQMLLKFAGAITGYVKVNGITALSGTSGSNNYFGQLDGQIVVRKGDLITATGNYDTENSRAYFYPMKGAN